MFIKKVFFRIFVFIILVLLLFQNKVYSELRYNISRIDYNVIVHEINNNGVYGGLYNNMVNFYMSPFYYDGTFHDLGILDGYHAGSVWGINDNGDLCGQYTGTPDTAFIYDGTGFKTLGNFGGSTVAFGINNSGYVCGSSKLSNGDAHAFLYDGTTMHDLGTLGGSSSYGISINNSGYVCGYSQKEQNGSSYAFLYDGTTMLDLNDLIDDDSFSERLDDAIDINDIGQIIARSGNHDYLLTPVSVPEPSAIAFFFFGLVWLIKKVQNRVTN